MLRLVSHRLPHTYAPTRQELHAQFSKMVEQNQPPSTQLSQAQVAPGEPNPTCAHRRRHSHMCVRPCSQVGQALRYKARKWATEVMNICMIATTNADMAGDTHTRRHPTPHVR